MVVDECVPALAAATHTREQTPATTSVVRSVRRLERASARRAGRGVVPDEREGGSAVLSWEVGPAGHPFAEQFRGSHVERGDRPVLPLAERVPGAVLGEPVFAAAESAVHGDRIDRRDDGLHGVDERVPVGGVLPRSRFDRIQDRLRGPRVCGQDTGTAERVHRRVVGGRGRFRRLPKRIEYGIGEPLCDLRRPRNQIASGRDDSDGDDEAHDGERDLPPRGECCGDHCGEADIEDRTRQTAVRSRVPGVSYLHGRVDGET